MALEIVFVHEQQSCVETIDARGYAFVRFKNPPCLLHLVRFVKAVYHQHSFLRKARQKQIRHPQLLLLRKTGMYIRHVDLLFARVYI